MCWCNWLCSLISNPRILEMKIETIWNMLLGFGGQGGTLWYISHQMWSLDYILSKVMTRVFIFIFLVCVYLLLMLIRSLYRDCDDQFSWRIRLLNIWIQLVFKLERFLEIEFWKINPAIIRIFPKTIAQFSLG